MSDTYNSREDRRHTFAKTFNMKRSLLFASMAIAAGLTLTNIYTSIVDAPAWQQQVPASIETARQYYGVTSPGNFFRIFSPLNQVLALLCLVLFWKHGRNMRLVLGAALLLAVATDALTFAYFYPRNAILFGTEAVDAGTLNTVLREWSSMNWVRTLIVALGGVCTAVALHFSYTAAPAVQKTKVQLEPAAALA
jgi:hypothetical protein